MIVANGDIPLRLTWDDALDAAFVKAWDAIAADISDMPHSRQGEAEGIARAAFMDVSAETRQAFSDRLARLGMCLADPMPD